MSRILRPYNRQILVRPTQTIFFLWPLENYRVWKEAQSVAERLSAIQTVLRESTSVTAMALPVTERMIWDFENLLPYSITGVYLPGVGYLLTTGLMASDIKFQVQPPDSGPLLESLSLWRWVG